MILNEYNFKNNIKDAASFEALKQLKLPDKTIEEFRHFDLDDIFSYEYVLPNPSDSTKVNKKELNNAFYSLVIDNGQINTKASLLSPFILLEKEHKKALKTLNALGYLSEVFFEHKILLKITKTLDKPLMILNRNSLESAFIPSSLSIEIGKDIEADIVDFFVSSEALNSFANTNRYFELQEHSTLNYLKYQNLSSKSSLILNIFAQLNTHSTFNSVALDYGGHKTLNSYDVPLNKENSLLNLRGIIKSQGKSKNGNIAFVDHVASNCSSNQEFKHILDDHTHALCDVKSVIGAKAPFSKAFQNLHTILLSDDAKINAQPRLQIYTDELEAKHGATTGALDEEQLNYLQLRGISKKEATIMLLTAFEESILNKIKNTTIRQFVNECEKGVHHV